MLRNVENVSISSPHQWPPQQISEEAAMPPTTTTTPKIMEKAARDEALKCPRCDSSNTKFCYYNNYSLSQPRHFCKACKRYWTRGGTLRNVPVGGGCRKNKRIKKPTSSDPPSSSIPAPQPPPPPPQFDVSAAPNSLNSSFYGLPTVPSDINLAFPRLLSRLAGPNSENLPISRSAFDLQPHLNSLWLNFPSNASDDYRSGAGFNTSQIQDPVTSPPSQLPDYSLLAPSSSASASAASLISSSFQQQKMELCSKENQPINDFQLFLPFEELQMAAANGNSGLLKGVKLEEDSNVMNGKTRWHIPCDNPIDTIASDSSAYWNTSMIGGWADGYGSVTHLI